MVKGAMCNKTFEDQIRLLISCAANQVIRLVIPNV